MSEEEKPSKEIITLHSMGAIPGIPGEHGPGTYEVDWTERTLTPVVFAEQQSSAPLQGTHETSVQLEAEMVHLEEEVKALADEQQNSDTSQS